jgi:Tol biopolymer transport system component
LTRDTDSRLTFSSGDDLFPVWSPDGTRIAFYSSRDVPFNTGGHPYQREVGGTGPDELLDKTLPNARVEDWSRDGRYLIIGASSYPKPEFHDWVLPLFGDRKPFPYLHADFNQNNAKVSPNSQWLAYASDETGRYEIYVQTFPSPGAKQQISTSGGNYPVWSKDGKELYFIRPDQKMMAVETNADRKFQAGIPKPLFDARLTRLYTRSYPWYDVSNDGHFLIPIALEQSSSVPMTVVINWTAGKLVGSSIPCRKAFSKAFVTPSFIRFARP